MLVGFEGKWMGIDYLIKLLEDVDNGSVVYAIGWEVRFLGVALP